MLRLVFLIFPLLLVFVWVFEKSAFAINPVFYALNTSAAAPPNVTALDALEDTTTTMLLFWTSGGGTTASYRIAYQSGTTAPASCTAGTQISEATVGSATNYIVTGLTANTKYSFRVCASNGAATYASGVTVTLTTPPSQPIFRSMGYNSTTAKTTGASNAMTVSGSIATFATGLAGNIGVGDAIQYSSANNATIDKIAFIHGRLSSTQFLVKTAAGNAAPTAVSGNTSWSIFRSYINFNNVVSGAENTGINVNVRNFDSWTGGANLVTLAATWYVECYADAPHAGTFTSVDSGWTTSANNKLVFTAPWETRHVGTRQRHVGAWSTSYFYATVTDNTVFEINIGFVVVDGLQTQVTYSGSQEWISAVMPGAGSAPPANSVIELNNNIFVSLNNSTRALDVGGIYTNWPGSGMKLYVTNNIVICVPGSGAALSKECLRGFAGGYTSNENVSWTAYFYNNTFVGSWYYGIDAATHGTGTKTIYAKNNIVQGSYYDAYIAGTWGGGTGYNIAQNATSTGGTGDKVNTTVAFVNAAGKDYHLAVGDTAAKNAGTNLSADVNYPFTMDIDMVTRSGTWDIGADEY